MWSSVLHDIKDKDMTKCFTCKGNRNAHRKRLTSSPPASPFVFHYESCYLSCPQDVQGRQQFLRDKKDKENKEKKSVKLISHVRSCALVHLDFILQ